MGDLYFKTSREFHLALGFYRTGLWDACLKIINRNRFSTSNPNAHDLNWDKLLIRLHLRCQDWRSAKEIAKKTLTNFPENPTVLHLLGRAWEMQGKNGRDQAFACFSKVRELAPNWLPNLKKLVTTSRKMGRLKETIVILRELVSLDPGCPSALSTLVSCLRKTGLTQEADTLVRQGRFLFASCPNFAYMYKCLRSNTPSPVLDKPCKLQFDKTNRSTKSASTNNAMDSVILRIQDHPRSRVMQAFALGTLRRS